MQREKLEHLSVHTSLIFFTVWCLFFSLSNVTIMLASINILIQQDPFKGVSTTELREEGELNEDSLKPFFYILFTNHFKTIKLSFNFFFCKHFWI